jgi:hypothetical protein
MGKEEIEAHIVRMDVEVPHNLLSDIMVTAFDGNYGGVQRCGWAVPVDYRIEGEGESVQTWREVVIESAPGYEWDGEENKTSRESITWAILVKGMQEILNSDDWAESTKKIIVSAILDDDAGEIDANLADTIVQTGLFGEEVYG